MRRQGISYATRLWLADLIAAGWTAEVSETPERVRSYTLRLTDDLEEAVRYRVSPYRVCVIARNGDSSVVIACRDADEARAMIEQATLEVEAA